MHTAHSARGRPLAPPIGAPLEPIATQTISSSALIAVLSIYPQAIWPSPEVQGQTPAPPHDRRAAPEEREKTHPIHGGHVLHTYSYSQHVFDDQAADSYSYFYPNLELNYNQLHW